jgi:hypothetical protein
VTDEDLRRITKRADQYFIPDPAYGAKMSGSRAIALAAVDVLQGASRELKRPVGLSIPEAHRAYRCRSA